MKFLVALISFVGISAYANDQLDPTDRCSGDAVFTESFCNKVTMYCPNDYGVRKLKLLPPGYGTSSIVDLEAAQSDSIVTDIINTNPEILHNCTADELKVWDFQVGL